MRINLHFELPGGMSLMAATLTTVEKQNGVETRDGGFWIGKGKIIFFAGYTGIVCKSWNWEIEKKK